MSEHAGNQDATGDEDPRRQLWIRAGVAGGLIALLLGGLALFDHVSRPPQPEEVALPTKPIAPARISQDAGRDAPPDVVRAGEEQAPVDAAPEASPEGSAPPGLPEPEPENPKAGAGRAAEGTRPLARPALSVMPPDASSKGSVREAPPAKSAVVSGARPAAPVPAPMPRAEIVAPAVTVPAVPARPVLAVPVPPVAAVVAAPSPAARPAAPVAESAQGYVLQFGFFSSMASAEALRGRLAQAGVPSQIETRLIVGPFADRKEALAAQARLREKGVDAGVLLPLGR